MASCMASVREKLTFSKSRAYYRNWLAFFLLGTINNLSYVIINSSAQSLTQSFNSEKVVGLGFCFSLIESSLSLPLFELSLTFLSLFSLLFPLIYLFPHIFADIQPDWPRSGCQCICGDICQICQHLSFGTRDAQGSDHWK